MMITTLIVLIVSDSIRVTGFRLLPAAPAFTPYHRQITQSYEIVGGAYGGSNLMRLNLDLSDILDDDSSEFLEALRRQMQDVNIMNASPREVTNRIKGFFVNSKRSSEEIINFKKVI